MRFSPRLPRSGSACASMSLVRDQRVEVDMAPAGTTYELLEGRGLPVKHFGEQLRVRPGQPVFRPALADDLPMAA